MSDETVQSSMNIPRGLREEFREFVEDVDGKINGPYSDHIANAMRMYMQREENLTPEDDLGEEGIEGVLRRLKRIERELGVYEVGYDEEFLIDTLSKRIPGEDRTEIAALVEEYMEYNVPPREIAASVSKELRRGDRDGVRSLSTVRKGEEGLTVEVRVTTIFGGSSKSSTGLLADRTDKVRFELDYDGGLRKDSSYRLDEVEIVDRREVDDGREEESTERVVKVDGLDLVTELDRRVPAHGGGDGFEADGMIVGFDETATGPGNSDDGEESACVVAFFDTGTHFYRIRIGEGVLRQSVLEGYSGDVDTSAIDVAMRKLRGRYYSIKGFDNTEDETDDLRKFSGIVVADMERGVNFLWDNEFREPRFPGRDEKLPWAFEPLPLRLK